MIVGVHAAVFSEKHSEGVGCFAYEILRRVVANNPDDTFLFFTPKPILEKYQFSANVIVLILPMPSILSRPIMLWLEYKVARACQANKVDIFFSPIGHFPLRLKIPVVTAIHDLNFEHDKNFLP